VRLRPEPVATAVSALRSEPEFNAKAQRRKGAKGGDGMTENEVAKIVVDAAIEVHRTLGGPGLLDAVYEEALAFELESRGLTVHRQRAVPLVYKGKRLASDFRLDLLVGERVIVECKATVAYNRVFEAQALTYLRLSDLKLALVINFGETKVKQGIHRVVNGLQE
jgi:GxxExxY protein